MLWAFLFVTNSGVRMLALRSAFQKLCGEVYWLGAPFIALRTERRCKNLCALTLCQYWHSAIAPKSFLIAGRQNDAASMTSTISAHIYEVRPRKMMNSRLINLV
jgi:hypothetical protein